MAKAFVGIGSNLGDRGAHLALARAELGALPRTSLAAFSPVYETAPLGPVGQGPFLNAAARLETELDPYDLLDALRAIETKAGREPVGRRPKWGPRVLDLDILLYDNRVVSSDELVIPHPLMHERWFVLRPLADLEPRLVHPLLEMTIGDLLLYVEQSDPAQTPRQASPGLPGW
jgi:2-amino-4-hydroxy-6-hydroxymethyldihydropteridine diphosphokinase